MFGKAYTVKFPFELSEQVQGNLPSMKPGDRCFVDLHFRDEKNNANDWSGVWVINERHQVIGYRIAGNLVTNDFCITCPVECIDKIRISPKWKLALTGLSLRWLDFFYWYFLHIYAFIIGPAILGVCFCIPKLYPMALVLTIIYLILWHVTRPVGVFLGFCITGLPLVIVYAGITLILLFGTLRFFAEWFLS